MKWQLKFVVITSLLVVVLAAVPTLGFGLDCSRLNDELSVINLMKSKLVADRKLDAALKESYGKLEYLSCIKDFNDDYV